MNKVLISLAAVSVALVSGCGNGTAPGGGGGAGNASATAQAAPSSAVDEALADAETGKDPVSAQARLETLLADATLKKEDHGRVALGLSRLVEKSDKERAIVLCEDATASGNDDAEKRLFVLLTGKDSPNVYQRRGAIGAVTESARLFSKYFPAATPGRQVEIEIDMFGGNDSSEGGPKGAFDVSSALREAATAACGLCDTVETSIHTHSSREVFWTAIPRYAGKLDKALVVLFIDQATIPPERYAKWLAAPIADIKAALDHGDGMIAIKERPGAPPLVVVAAPRMSQFGTVETALSQMKTVPAAPVTITIAPGLSKDEVQAGVRSNFPALKQCYESFLKRKPAGGTIDLAFTIGGDGTVSDLVVGLDPALEDSELRSCIHAGVEKIKYPAFSRDPKDTTTVKYPIIVTP